MEHGVRGSLEEEEQEAHTYMQPDDNGPFRAAQQRSEIIYIDSKHMHGWMKIAYEVAGNDKMNRRIRRQYARTYY